MDASSGTVQLNVRMDRTLKEEGDAVLSARGFSPSQIVRSLWKTVAKGGDALDRVVSSFEEDEPEQAQLASHDAQEDCALRGTLLFEEGCSLLGITGESYQPDTRLWSDIREESIESRLLDRGVL